MKNTEKKICRMTAHLLAAYGVRDVVLCPGNRNAPLIMAVERHPELRAQTVVDERVGSFVALGMAAQSGRPAAVVCTSGSAVLDCAPAVAEAYYRQIPLVVISADRPADFIDNGQPQTIRQAGVLANIVRCSVDIEPEDSSERRLTYANRRLNKALTAATGHPCGPVHINIQIDTPLAAETEVSDAETFRKIELTGPCMTLPTREARQLGQELAPPRKVLIVCGAMAPDDKVRNAVSRLARIPNIAVLAEDNANVNCGEASTACNIDAVLASLGAEQRRELLPGILITVGAPLVSGRLGAFLSGHPDIQHWSINEDASPIDTYGILTRHIQLPARSFLPQLASAVQPFRTTALYFGKMWQEAAEMTMKAAMTFTPETLWNDFTAMRELVSVHDKKINVHVSNGMSVRLFQALCAKPFHRTDCNRGVSGIDGATSTAIGAAMVTDTPVMLISGDMSAQYDMGALAVDGVPASFRMVVFSNRGGNIFRIVGSTRGLEEREHRFCNIVSLPLEQLAEGFGFDYYEARDKTSLRALLPHFLDVRTTAAPAILNIVTDGDSGAEAWRAYIRSISHNE